MSNMDMYARVMTREEEVRAAIDEIFPCTDEGRCYEQAIGASGFELGVKWADKHPTNKWHDASEEPVKGRLILFKDKYGYNIITWINCNNCNWVMYVASSGVQKWAYISDLLPKGGEE